MRLPRCAWNLSFSLAMILGGLALSAEPVSKTSSADVPRARSKVSIPSVEQGRVLRTEESQGHRVVIDEAGARLSLSMQKEESTRSKKEFRVGDTVKTLRATSLQAKGNTPVPLPKNEYLGVRAVDPQWGETRWVGVGVLHDGQVHTGWIPVADVELVCEEPQLVSDISSLATGEFASAGVLIQKAKIFDDGLMATVQLAAQTGQSRLRGKAQWLPQLIALSLKDAPAAARVQLAAARLGNLPVEMPANEAGKINALIQAFRADERKSKPIGFYTWSEDLVALFQQDRMLQSRLEPSELAPLVIALQDQQALRADYEAYVSLISRLTNPPVGSDLRTLLAGEQVNTAEIPFISASQAPETNLMRKLFGVAPVPQGFDLATELVKRIQGGELSLAPGDNSGWYDHQLWSLEPLVIPGQTSEAVKWTGNDEYLEHLEALFKGAWALTRETHIKDLDFPEAGAAPIGDDVPKIQITVRPRLTSEPLATCYRRRADSYRFIKQVLFDVFGEDGVAAMRRQTSLGPLDRPLLEELTEIEHIFDGAACLVERELGIVSENQAEESTRTERAKQFLDFLANADRDPDISADVRMMVPVFFDLQRKQSKVWIFLGWSNRSLSYAYSQKPSVVVFDLAGNQVPPEKFELNYHGRSERVIMPVFREIFVSRLLNRDEFRQVCDAYVTPRAIVEHLK